jgi:hypothetical protein
MLLIYKNYNLSDYLIDFLDNCLSFPQKPEKRKRNQRIYTGLCGMTSGSLQMELLIFLGR